MSWRPLMDGLGLWLGEGRVIECSTSLKSTPPESKNILAIKAIRAWGGRGYCFYVGVANDMLVSSWQAAHGHGGVWSISCLVFVYTIFIMVCS